MCNLVIVMVLTIGQNPSVEERADHEVKAFVAARDARTILTLIGKWEKCEPWLRHAIVARLSESLDSSMPLKLEETDDLIIANRNLKFHGHGLVVAQDLFLENGRCAYAIETVLSIRLPRFVEGMTTEQVRQAARESHLRIIRTLRIP